MTIAVEKRLEDRTWLDDAFTTFSKCGALILVGWFACSWWYGTGTFEKVETALPKVQAEAGCEHWRAGVATKLALGPTMVDPSQIPKDCPHPYIPLKR